MDELLDSLTHFFGRLIGEGDGKDVVRCYTLVNQVYDAVRDNAGFPRASPRKDEERAFGVEHGLALWAVEASQVWDGIGHVWHIIAR